MARLAQGARGPSLLAPDLRRAFLASRAFRTLTIRPLSILRVPRDREHTRRLLPTRRARWPSRDRRRWRGIIPCARVEAGRSGHGACDGITELQRVVRCCESHAIQRGLTA